MQENIYAILRYLRRYLILYQYNIHIHCPALHMCTLNNLAATCSQRTKEPRVETAPRAVGQHRESRGRTWRRCERPSRSGSTPCERARRSWDTARRPGRTFPTPPSLAAEPWSTCWAAAVWGFPGIWKGSALHITKTVIVMVLLPRQMHINMRIDYLTHLQELHVVQCYH